MTDGRYEFFATCPEGFERALADELRGIRIRGIRPLKGRVTFSGSVVDGERACLWSRLASRIFAVLARFEAVGADELYEGVYAIPWERVLRPGATISVNARGTTPELRNTHFTALKVKDALCDRLADEAGRRADVDTERPDARISVTLRGERVTLALDLSGEPLFRRMPRAATRPDAPAHFLRPDYAALMLAQVSWAARCVDEADGHPALIDICCAGGGIAVEAAVILADRAPGRARRHWGFQGWGAHDEDAWNELVDEADAREHAARARGGRVVATDPDARSRSFARHVAESADVAARIAFVEADVHEILRAAGEDARAVLALDTLNATAAKVDRCAKLARALRENGTPAVAVTRDEMGLWTLGAAERRLRVMPGNDDAWVMVFDGRSKAESHGSDTGRQANKGHETALSAAKTTVDLGRGKPVPVLLAESEQFANRLKKNARTWRRWAKREGVTCYRVYDADLPEYAAAIDLYEGCDKTPGRWLVVAEYAAPRSVDPELARARLRDMLAIAPVVLEVEPGDVYARARTRSRGGSQYGKRESLEQERMVPSQPPLIQEGGLTFEVDFGSYLDTGIFLDHRITRGLIRERARALGAKRFLNLFAYTGTATCYAADAGMPETTTVDLSNTYLDWAERNMARNGFTGRGHRFIRADVLRWIDEQMRGSQHWDLIFCDPPTFSNSAKMGARTWDVQRDHVELLTALAGLLAPGGEAIFSCNLRTFKPDADALARAGVALEDISAKTIPADFARNPRIHRCYVVRGK